MFHRFRELTTFSIVPITRQKKLPRNFYLQTSNNYLISMDPPLPDPKNLHDDDVFLDASNHFPFHHCSDHSPESPSSVSCFSDLGPPSPPPASVIRRRSSRRLSPINESPDTNSTNVDTTKSQNLPTSKENEILPEKLESDQEKVDSFPSQSVVTEERNEESTLTTASHEDSLGDSAESVPELIDSNSTSLEYVAGLVIKAIVFQIKIFIMLIKCPILIMFHACMFCVDPFGTMRKGKSVLIGNLGRVWFSVSRFIDPSALGFSEHKSFWNVAFKCGWGLLWSIYVCCILFGLLVSSLVVSGFLVKRFVEKPFQMKQVLNFDYTNQTPVAFVPIISCPGVAAEYHSDKNDIAVDRLINKRVIPPKQKVQVTVSLLVPESEYNANLGVFQIRVDFLSSNGNTIASSRQPTMLKFRSEPIRLITIFLKLVPLLTGYISETQTLVAKMRGFVEGANVPTSCLKVTLEQRAEYLPGAGIPEIYESSIFIESQLPLFKRIIWYWKISIFIWIAIMAFVMELLVVLLCCWPMIIPRPKQRSSSTRSTGTQNNPQAPS